MEKRLILAISLSLLVLLSWSAWVSKFHPVENKEVRAKTLPLLTTPESPKLSLEEPTLPSPTFRLSQEKCEIIFSENLATIEEVIFKDYQSYRFPLKYGLWLADKNLVFQKEVVSDKKISFVYRAADKQITKRFIFSNSNYYIELEIDVQNLASTPINLNLPLVLGTLNFSGDPNEARFKDVTVATLEKIWHLNGRKEMVIPQIKFLGLRDRYFCAIIEPIPKDNYTAYLKKLGPQETEVSLSQAEFLLNPQQKIEQKFRIYLGPQDLRIINRINPEWSQVMYYGTFNLISHLLLQLLGLLYRLAHNWGLAIVILSLLVYLLLYPLTLKQMRSMKEMQVLQPRIEELRKAYKDNPQKLNKEIMELYREHKVNPLGGCLPLILQMPIFFALYQALMRSIALKGARFLWIKDLSEPDRLFVLPNSLPILGNEINLLPILMTLGMFIQQKISTRAAAGVSGEQQKLMLIIFPLMFGFIFYHMPAGLVLYWFINSSFMLIYQIKVSRAK